MKFSPRLLSVIIVNKDDRGIEATLDHLVLGRQTDVPFEVIVVDKSRPEEMADIRAKHAWARWDIFPRTQGRSTPAQRNRGIELAKGDVIVFIDANCIPAEQWLPAIWESLKAGEDIVCGPVLDLNEQSLVHYAPSLTQGEYVPVCTTINVAIRRRVIDRIGLFDTNFAFGQDIDFFWRASDAGFKIYYNPEVIIGHDWGAAKEQLRRAYDYGKARAHLLKKHWRTRKHELKREPHVWMYPVFILGLPLTMAFPFYPLLILVPVLKNRSQNPFALIVHHLSYGIGVIAGALKKWPTAA